jgi:hypothetical protein
MPVASTDWEPIDNPQSNSDWEMVDQSNVAPSAAPQININPLENLGSFQPSQFSSGMSGLPSALQPTRDQEFQDFLQKNPTETMQTIQRLVPLAKTPEEQARLGRFIAAKSAPELPVSGTMGQIWDALWSAPKPIKDIVEVNRGIRQSEIDTAKKLRATAEAHGLDPDKFAKLPGVAEQIAGGAGDALVNLAQTFTSPAGVLTLGIGALPKTAQKAVAFGFGAQMLSSAPGTANEIIKELQKPESERDYRKIAQLTTEGLAQTGLGTLSTAHGVKLFEPTAAEKVATVLNRTEPNIPEGTVPRGGAPTVYREPAPFNLNISPDVLHDTPQLQDLVNKALQERNQNIIRPGEVSATDQLLNPTPNLVPQPERNIKQDYQGGQVSFAAEARAKAVPSARQSANESLTQSEKTKLQDFVNQEASQGAVFDSNKLPNGVSYRRPKEAPSQEEYQRRLAKESVYSGLNQKSGFYLDEPTGKSLPEPVVAPDRAREGVSIVSPGTGQAIEKLTPLSALQRSRLRVALARGASEQTIKNILRLEAPENPQALKKNESQLEQPEKINSVLSGVDFSNTQKPHRAGIVSALENKLTPEDVPRLQEIQKETLKNLNDTPPAGRDAAFKDAFGKMTYIGGLIEGALKKGPNYDLFLKEQEASPSQSPTTEPTVKLYRGQNDAIPGGGYWTTDPVYAAKFGKNVQEISVPKSVADAARESAKKEGNGTPGAHILPPEISKNATPMPEDKVPIVVQDLTPGESVKNTLHQAADLMESLKSGINGGTSGQINALGIIPAVWDAAVSTAQKILRAGGSAVDAVAAAIDYLRKNNNGKFDEQAVREALDVWKQGGMKLSIDLPTKTASGRFVEKLKNISDFVTTNPLPKMQRSGVDTIAAIQHAYARIAVPRMVDDLLSKVFPESFTDTEAMSKVMDILNKDNILGGYDEFLSRAKQAALDGDTRAANKWQKMADSVGSTQDIETISKEVEAAKNDPVISGAIERWKQVVNPELDTLYNEIKGADPATEREGRGRVFGARVNLLPKSEESQWQRVDDPNRPAPSPSSSNYRNPNAKRDKFDRAAKFTGNYSTDAAAVLSNVLYPRWNEVTKLRFYDELVKSGNAQWIEPGMDLPESIKGQKVKRLQVKVPETGDSGLTQQVEKTLAVPENLVGEIRGVLDTDLNLKQNPIAKGLTQVQLLQLADATSHLKNIHSVIANSMGAKTVFADIAKKFPGLATGDAIVRISKVVSEIAQDTPAMREELAVMAKNGMLREHYPSTGIQKITKMQDLIHSVDTASRVVMNRFFDNLVDRGLVEDTMKGRRDFVQQIGEYNKRLMSPMMKMMSRSGLSPFIVAGRNFNRFSKRLLIGSPGVKGANTSAAVQMRAVNLLGLVTVATIPAMINAVTTGSIWGRRGTPVGAIDLGGQEDDRGSHKVLDLFQLMGIRRGLRATGVSSIVEGIANGRSPGQIVDNAISDATSTAAHPWMGPALGAAYSILTGKRLDLRGGPTPYDARKVASGQSQLAENARVALKNQNSLIYSAMRPLFGDTEKSYGKDLVTDFLKAPLSAVGVRDVKPPELMEAQKLAASGEQMTVDQADRAKLKRELAAGVRADSVEGKQKLMDMVASGDLTKQAKTDIEKRAALSKLQYTVEKYLTPADAMQVYNMSSPENKDSLRKIIGIKIINNDTLTDDEKKNLFDSISKGSSVSDVMQYPPIKFSIESSGKPYHFLISSKQQFEFEQLKGKNFDLVKSNLEANPNFSKLSDAEKESILRSAKSRTDAISKADFFKANYNTVKPLQ